VDQKLFYNHHLICAEFEAFKRFGVYLPHKKKHKLFDLLQAEVLGQKPSITLGITILELMVWILKEKVFGIRK